MFPYTDMNVILKPIENIGINRCIAINDRGCTIIAANANTVTAQYYDDETEEIPFGTLVDPYEAPIFRI